MLAVDIGGTKIASAVVLDGEVLYPARTPTPAKEGAAAVLAAALNLAAERLTLARASGTDVVACGVGSAGTINDQGIVTHATDALPGWRGTDLTAAFTARLGIPVTVLNDVHAWALGEAHHGAAKGSRLALILTLGTGVGGALIANGNPLRGRTGMTGSLGHTPATLPSPQPSTVSGPATTTPSDQPATPLSPSTSTGFPYDRASTLSGHSAPALPLGPPAQTTGTSNPANAPATDTAFTQHHTTPLSAIELPPVNDRLCPCGRTGHLEAYASGPAILSTYRAHGGTATDLRDLNPATDPLAHTVITEAATILGTTIASAATLLDPDMIVLGGGVTGLGDVLMTPLIQAVRHEAPPGPDSVPIRLSTLGEYGAILGAAHAALHDNAPPP